MKNLELSQFTGFYKIIFPRDHEPAQSRAIIAGFLDRLAKACQSAGAEVIGHIKILATNPDGGYLRGSVTSTHISADVAAIDLGLHRSLDIHLIVLVYGADRDGLESAIHNVWSNLMDAGLITSVEQLPSPTIK
ncbi:hypothetical protein ACFLZW_06145 [Chloroflexota bacterium]